MLNGVGVQIRLKRNKDTFCLMANAVNILDCKLCARKVKISPSAFIAHNKVLEGINAKYSIRRFICRNVYYTSRNLDHTLEKLVTCQLPIRIFVGYVDNDAFIGCFSKISFNFNFNFIHSSHSKKHGKYCTRFDSEFQLNVKGYEVQALTHTLYTKNKIT